MVSSRTLRAFLVYTGLAVLLLTLLYICTQPRGIHLARAQLLVQYTQDYPPPSRTQDWQALAGQWREVELPHAPRPNMLPGGGDAGLLPTQTSWYHFTLDPAQEAPHGAYLYIPRWKTDGELAIYVDGRLFWQTHANLQWNGSNRPLWIPLEEAAESKPPRDLLIRIRHVRGIGGALSTLWLGDYRQLAAAYYTRAFFQAELPYISSAMFLATGVFAFLIWLRRRSETLYLLYALMTLVTFLRVMHAYMGADRLPVSDAWFGWVTVNSVGWAVLVTHLFLTAVHHHHARWLTAIIAIMCLGFGGITLPLLKGAPDATIVSPLMYITMVSVGAVTYVLHIVWSRRVGSAEGAGLAICGLLTFALGGRDMLLQNNIINIESLFISFYAQIALIIVFCQIMLSRYLKAMKAVADSNVVLASRLAERESELNASHLKLREIERREVLLQERQRLMQDMHDGLGSSLVSTLRMVEHGHIDEADIAQLLKGCIDDLKLTIDSMEPVETDLLLLLGTLRFRLQPRLESTGIRLRWEVRDVPPLAWLDQRHSLHVLRILQEAFTNVIKHAGASEITVTTGVRDGQVCVGVADNGRGFDTAAEAAGRGLGNQARRAEVIGGSVLLESGADGTRFTLLLPIEGAAAR
ncbi:sensor histidine kinase [Sphingomonas sp. R-74633]|uniref:sensor histidine kinase n=1 Tax=Sphingomonas sp. R-74633 TaxID=2751188 RepID=UPI0015D1939F|nr:ATP-binding protein [Sphingomonas sp. R-74633]NYT40321.1 sensor histidine kinase [Sphingomonas sp. R-74633]